MVLFTAKRSASVSLALAALLGVVALAVREALDIQWALALDSSALVGAGAAVLLLLASDAAGHHVLTWTSGTTYERTFQALAEYFTDQSPSAAIAGGVLAAAEEFLFRGVVLAGLVQVADAPPGLAIGVAAVAFGLAHLIREPPLSLFVLWSWWEGVLLGLAFVLTGSLAAVALAHAVHDVVGFGIFATRRRGWTDAAGTSS